MKQRAVFFDRDDTLMVNVPYLGDPTLVEIFPEAAAALYALRKADFLLFVVSNQSGVGRGLITRGQVSAVDAEMKRQLETRKAVERAKGILQRRQNLTEEEAYLRLRNESRRLRRPMKDLAEAIILAEELGRRESKD